MDNVWLRFIIIGHPPKQWSGKKQMTTINETIPIVHGNSLKLSLNGNYWSLPLNYLYHVIRSTTVIMHSTVVSFCCANLGINTAVINWLAMTSLNFPSFKANRIWPLWWRKNIRNHKNKYTIENLSDSNLFAFYVLIILKLKLTSFLLAPRKVLTTKTN